MSNKHEFNWFEKDEIDSKTRFFRIMDLLITNKSSSSMEALIVLGIFFLQILSGFFDSNIGMVRTINSSSDSFLNGIYTIFRLRGLTLSDYNIFQIVIYLFFVFLILLFALSIVSFLMFRKSSPYGWKELIVNVSFKIFTFVLFNPILDFCLSTLCFGSFNHNFPTVACTSANTILYVIAAIVFLASIGLNFFLNIYYNDAFFLTNSFYARINCGYEVLLTINSVIYSVLLTQSVYIGKEVFLIYNIVVSLMFMKFYFNKYLFYDQSINALAGAFHLLYVWTSIFTFVFSYINLNERGVIYLVGCIIVVWLFFNLRYRMQDNLLLKIPFHKISSKFHLLFYLKSIIDNITVLESSVEAKSKLIGIIQHHKIECPNSGCISKHKDKKIYLPLTDEWSHRDKPEIEDKVYLVNLVIIIINYFIAQNFYSPEILMNISMYFLVILGNFCQAIYYYNRVAAMRLTADESFALNRLKYYISKALVEKLKHSSEICSDLFELNVTYYYKYDDLGHKLTDEMVIDIGLSLDLWKTLKVHHETGRPLDFNKLFDLTDKIRLSKNKIEKIWKEMYSTHSGINDMFDLYQNYVETINDDDLTKRELDQAKNKTISSSDSLQINYYNNLFNKETGIIIINGTKNKEGLIEKINETVEKIFNVKNDDVKGLNITVLMPKMFEKFHKSFLERFVESGEKRRIDKSGFKSYAKDLENCIISMKFMVKFFPMLNNEVYYCGLALKDNIDDLILIDSRFMIQGMSKKLMDLFQLDNKDLFVDTDIPFYIICKKFLIFYRLFLSANSRRSRKNKNKSRSHLSSAMSSNQFQSSNNLKTSAQIEEEAKEEEEQKNIEEIIDEVCKFAKKEDEPINENIEYEYEICVPQFLHDYTGFGGPKEAPAKKDDDDPADKIYKEVDAEDAEEGDKLVNNHNQKEEENEANINKLSDEEKEFATKIKQYKSLFDNGKFTELEEFADKNNQNSKEFKFNFTFSRYNFGEGQYSFVIRCLDNKSEEFSISANSIDATEEDKEKALRQQKLKLESLQALNEITIEDKSRQIDILNDYIKLSNEDKSFLRVNLDLKEDIVNNSKIFGVKKEEEEGIKDEAASQNAGTGYNENIAKKARIEEIRSGMMESVPNFKTFKFIRFIFYFIIVLTAVFSGLYMMIFNIVYNDLFNIALLNGAVYQTTIWTCNILSSLISMRSFYNFNLNDKPIKFNSFIVDSNEYFETQRGFTDTWYNNIMLTYGPLEQQVTKYFINNTSNENYFWDQTKITYPPSKGVTLVDSQSLNNFISHTQSDVNNLIRSKYFTNNNVKNITGFSPHIVKYLSYSAQMAIENTIDNLIPQLFMILNSSESLFTVQNSSNMTYVTIIIIAYAFIILILLCLYAVLLFTTNKNMEEGFEKVSKIKLDKIDETIKKIENFNDRTLGKFKKHDNNKIQSVEKSTQIQKQESAINQNTTAQGQNQNKDFSKIFTEGQKYTKLSVLNVSYVQFAVIVIVCCANLIPIFLVSRNMITSSNQVLSVSNYIYGLSLTASSNTVKIKCNIAQCLLQNPDVFQLNIAERADVESLIRGLTDFPEIGDFYNNKFLLNACGVLYDSVNNATQYGDCMNDVTIKSANNTDSMLKLIDETISNILKDKEMKLNLPYTLADGSTTMFSTPYLYETVNFRNLEYIFYTYITPVSDNFSKVVTLSQNTFLNRVNTNIVILICVFVLCILVISFYIAFIFTKTLVHLFSVARLIVKLIPTNVINNTQELEMWMENTL
jgi:hypothetical protein